MKIEINTTGRAIEIVNCILGQAIDELMKNCKVAKLLSLTGKDIEIAERFRLKLLNKLLKS